MGGVDAAISGGILAAKASETLLLTFPWKKESNETESVCEFR